MMRIASLLKFTVLAVIMSAIVGITPQATQAQNPLEIIKKAAVEAKKKKADEEARKKREREKQPTPTPEETPRVSSLQASSAKVETQVLLTAEPGLQYAISPKGQHVAAVVLRGSRQVVVYDGVDGPKFDEILNAPGVSGKAAWSEDGSRHAYFGRVGQEYVVMVDGKEVQRGPWSAELASQGQAPVHWLGFTPGGKHWYLIVHTRTAGRDHYQLIIDGKAGPVSEGDVTPVWSPDGEHHAYIRTVFPTTAPQPSFGLIVDGKPAPYLAAEPQFTADGLHLFTKRQIPRSSSVEVLADGKAFMRGEGIQLHMAPVGPGVLGVVWTPFQNGVRSAFLTVGNRKVSGSDCTASAGIDAVYTSADGKHYAARCPNGWMLVDGKKSLEYPGGLSDVVFTADGRAVYQATTNNRTFLIIGDQESDGYTSITKETARTRAEQNTTNFRSPPAVVRGNHVGYIARPGADYSRSVVVVDGKSYPAVNASQLVLSPDGSRFAFLSGHPYLSVTVDGMAYPGMTVDPGLGNIGFQGTFHWSADSKHVAWISGNPWGVAIDGKLVATQGAPRFLNFTADGRHLLWLIRVPTAPLHAIFVDGAKVLELPQNLPLENEADIYWSFGENGTVTLVAQDGNEMKRFRITPGTDTSVETMLAKATKPR